MRPSFIQHKQARRAGEITTNSAAALRFAARIPPDLDEVRAALNRIIGQSRHASEVFDGIRDLFRKVSQTREPIYVNELIRAVETLRPELTDNGVLMHTQLEPLPSVEGHKGQLQEVVINIVHNAIEALQTSPDRKRQILIKTNRHKDVSVAVYVEDTGPGIDPSKLKTIFDAFVTTKTEGMGLGLAICQRIIETHHGELAAFSDGKSGARFEIILPTCRVPKPATVTR